MSKLLSSVTASLITVLGIATSAHAADQTVPGAGNAAAVALASKSPIVLAAGQATSG